MCLYNQGYIEKYFFLLKPSKSEVVNLVKNFSLEKFYFKILVYIYKQL